MRAGAAPEPLGPLEADRVVGATRHLHLAGGVRPAPQAQHHLGDRVQGRYLGQFEVQESASTSCCMLPH